MAGLHLDKDVSSSDEEYDGFTSSDSNGEFPEKITNADKKNIDIEMSAICERIRNELMDMQSGWKLNNPLSNSLLDGIIDELAERLNEIESNYWYDHYNFHLFFVHKSQIVPPCIEIKASDFGDKIKFPIIEDL